MAEMPEDKGVRTPSHVEEPQVVDKNEDEDISVDDVHDAVLEDVDEKDAGRRYL